MVFVDEIHATLETTEGESIEVNYKMSAIEKQICHLIPYQVSKYLNEWFDGAVNFQVDTYFTTVPLGRESFSCGTNSSDKSCYYIFANKISEITGILDNYRSVIITFGMNDYDSLLRGAAGVATNKYAAVHLESLLKSFFINNVPLETLLDIFYQDWESIAILYLHEFTHTVEMCFFDEHGLTVYEFHEFIKYYIDQGLVIKSLK